MDVQMPEMDGYEATAKIREISFGKDIPIIALIANAFQSDIDQALERGEREVANLCPIIRRKFMGGENAEGIIGFHPTKIDTSPDQREHLNALKQGWGKFELPRPYDRNLGQHVNYFTISSLNGNCVDNILNSILKTVISNWGCLLHGWWRSYYGFSMFR
jgi:CheY-like chemotaxis protein